MSERHVYSVQQLLRLRPPRPTLPPSDPLRTAPLPIPRRPSPSPTRSPPPSRFRNASLSASPPPSDRILSSSLDSTTLRGASPLLPPGFGPPRSTGPGPSASPPQSLLSINASSNGGSSTTALLTNVSLSLASSSTLQVTSKGSRGAQRIARGPNPSANFASRIAFAAATRKPQPLASTQQEQQQISQSRNIQIESEINRLFADEPPAPPVAVSFERNPVNRFTPNTNSNSVFNTATAVVNQTTAFSPISSSLPPPPSLPHEQQQQQASSFQDAAATLASVAYPLATNTSSTSPTVIPTTYTEISTTEETNQDQLNITFEDFAKQLAAVASKNVVDVENNNEVPSKTVVNVNDVEEPEQAEIQPHHTLLQSQQEPLVEERVVADLNETVEKITVESEEKNIQAEESMPNPEKENRSNDDVAALAKWFSSLAAAADVVEGTGPSPSSLNTAANVIIDSTAPTSTYSVLDSMNNNIHNNNEPNDTGVVRELISNPSDYNHQNQQAITDIRSLPNEDVDVDQVVIEDNPKNTKKKSEEIIIDQQPTFNVDTKLDSESTQAEAELETETGNETESVMIDNGIVSFFKSVLKRTMDGEMMEWSQQVREGEEMVEIDFELDDLIDNPTRPTQPVTVTQSAASSALDDMMTHMERTNMNITSNP